jgi:hypothetical protein
VSQKAKIVYREFYDVPRILVLSHRGLKILLDCKFDESLDEYAPTYRVYVLPNEIDERALQSWETLPGMAIKFLGSVPVDHVNFDSSKRAEIETAVIDSLLGDKAD